MEESTKEKALQLIVGLRRELVWNTSDGRKFAIASLSDKHLKAIIVFLHKMQKEYDDAGVGDYVINKLKAKEWLEILRDELTLRTDKPELSVAGNTTFHMVKRKREAPFNSQEVWLDAEEAI
jgi:hypothetical protein